MGGKSREEAERPRAVGNPSRDRRGRDALGSSRGGRLLNEDLPVSSDIQSYEVRGRVLVRPHNFS